MNQQKQLHIAPMINYSTREFRHLFRILSRRAVLWTEMVVDETVNHVSNVDEHLFFEDNTHPIICQIGGNSPELCGRVASVVLERYGYDEVNLNIDCPSERVSGKREFGAILMKKAELAREILQQMQARNAESENSPSSDNDINTPSTKISVKCRIGVDDLDDLQFAAQFISALLPVCRRFYLHARKCVLNGLMNARQNRSVPPLNYPRVYKLCEMFPECEFWINGGIRTLQDARLVAYGTEHCFETDENSTIPPSSGANLSCENTCGSYANHLHQVPCQLCNFENGSCVAPSWNAPFNLRGVMMGRAAIDDPCLFHNVDRYFYGERSNPCTNRREVLERYCEYLEQTYPRRCCDNDERITYEYPAPDVVFQRDYCQQCVDVYGPEESRNDNHTILNWSESTKGDAKSTDDNEKSKGGGGQAKPKIASRIIARSLKPVQGLFCGVPKSRAFRRCCDELGQNVHVRNCGPAAILRKAMRSVPPAVLDGDF